MNMVLVLPSEFSAPGGQINGLDNDVAEEQLDQRPKTKEELLAVAFNEVIPRDERNKYRHLKPLYISAHVEGVPMSKVFVDCGAMINILPYSLMRKLDKLREDLIPSDVVISSFVGDKSKTIGVLPLKITVADQTRVAAFYVVESSVDYNILLGRDWIHQSGCIPSSLFQLLFFWDGQRVSTYPADEKPFETNAVQARIYDDDVGWMIDKATKEEGAAAVTDLLERLLEHWAEESLQPNSPINLIEFLHKSDEADTLTFDDLETVPAEMEDDYPEVQDPLLEINFSKPRDPQGRVSHAYVRPPGGGSREARAPVFHGRPEERRRDVPFDLKNVGATTPARRTIRPGAIETYEWVAFTRMWAHGLKMNPKKCAFSVTAGNFLGFLVDKNKATAIMAAPPPRTKKELQSFLDTERFVWGTKHQAALDDIKKYLSQPPVLMPPKRGKPLRLYISASEGSIGCLLAQNNENYAGPCTSADHTRPNREVDDGIVRIHLPICGSEVGQRSGIGRFLG
ncbi:unnamed protein product [Prunus brigantina]